jgi:glycosyltransferase involved in cell wall biosynthesis
MEKKKFILVIKTVSFLDDILKFQITNYNNNDNIKKIIILNYDYEKNNNYGNMKEMLEKKSKIIYLKDYNYKIKNIFDLLIGNEYLYVNTDFNTYLTEDKLDELHKIYLNKSCDLMYFYGINLFLNNKYVIKNKFYGLGGVIYLFNNKCCIYADDDFKIVGKENINIKYLLDNTKDNYYCYSLINCFKESLFFELFKNEYIDTFKKFDIKYNDLLYNNYYDYMKKMRKCVIHEQLNWYFNKIYFENINNVEKLNIFNNKTNNDEILEGFEYTINDITKIYERIESKIDINNNDIFKNKPVVSIIMTVYNKEEYLEDCIESMLRQTWKNIELILVDDYSSDSSRDILKKYLTNPKIKIILNEENLGCYKSRNKAIKNATGTYIGFQDTDDYSLKTRIEEQMNFLIENKLLMCGCNMIRSHLKNINYSNDVIILKDVYANKCNEMMLECCKEFFGYPTLIINKTLFDKYGLYLGRRKGMDMEFPERVIFNENKYIFNESEDSWEFFNNYTKNNNEIFSNTYLKYEKLLVISPQMNNNNITNNIISDDFLKNKEWRLEYKSDKIKLN